MHRGPKAWFGPRCALRSCGCRAVRYCSRNHQAADRAVNKIDCNEIKKMRESVVKQESGLRRGGSNPSETQEGRFWETARTKNHLRALYALAKYHGRPDDPAVMDN
ncbi:hypothetical protein SEUCBS139899_004221 [Sporothrix eucalyptigena]